MSAEESSGSVWSWEQDKQFENAIASYGEDCSDRWDKIAAEVPGKSVVEVKHHYELLVDDINAIESCFAEIPCYNSGSDGSTNHAATTKKGANFGNSNGHSSHGGRSSKSVQECCKAVAWTMDEHRLFLMGLEKCGRGDWKTISRNFVVTKTPPQVTSHAQKYFIRLNSMNKCRRRSSIHDMTNVNNGNGDVSVPQVPITGQINGSAEGGSSGNPNKSLPQSPVPVSATGVGMYGPPTMGQPIIGPLVSTVCTPVNLPPPPHLAYGVGAPVHVHCGIGAPVHGPVVPGAPMNMVSVPYLVQQMSGHR